LINSRILLSAKNRHRLESRLLINIAVQPSIRTKPAATDFEQATNKTISPFI